MCSSTQHRRVGAHTSARVCRIPLRDLYEQQLNDFAERVSGLNAELYGRGARRLSRRERSARMLEALDRPDMQLPGVPSVAGKVFERGPRQLEALTRGSEWCLTIVDIKMTSTQTPQGKTQRYSAMVIVGNLKVRRTVASRVVGGPLGCVAAEIEACCKSPSMQRTAEPWHHASAFCRARARTASARPRT